MRREWIECDADGDALIKKNVRIFFSKENSYKLFIAFFRDTHTARKAKKNITTF